MTNLFYGKKTRIARALMRKGIRFRRIYRNQSGDYTAIWETSGPPSRLLQVIGELKAASGSRYFIHVDQPSYNYVWNSPFATRWTITHTITLVVEPAYRITW